MNTSSPLVTTPNTPQLPDTLFEKETLLRQALRKSNAPGYSIDEEFFLSRLIHCAVAPIPVSPLELLNADGIVNSHDQEVLAQSILTYWDAIHQLTTKSTYPLKKQIFPSMHQLAQVRSWVAGYLAWENDDLQLRKLKFLSNQLEDARLRSEGLLCLALQELENLWQQHLIRYFESPLWKNLREL